MRKDDSLEGESLTTHRKEPRLRGPGVPTFLIFTDLDGTLLDHNTYRWEEAKPALAQCSSLQVPVVLVSSKTRAEMDVLRAEMGLSWPFISENGGGIFFPKEETPGPPPGATIEKNTWKWSLGLPYERLVDALREIRKALRWNIRGFSDMTPEEICRLTGLDPESGRLAAMREFDEPFIIKEPEKIDLNLLHDAARRRGLHITTGGRFHHLQGKNDKGEAVEKLISWYKQLPSYPITIALGDSPNDFSMLKRVDHPVLVRTSRHFPEIEQEVPGLRITRETGPRGWNEAVLELLGAKSKGGIS
ncbi:MAG: HAD-IIB family hydrolase [Desulfobacteraceae bacterium]|jgi:mannosyl-3-phosphoglycerate phosphatase